MNINPSPLPRSMSYLDSHPSLYSRRRFSNQPPFQKLEGAKTMVRRRFDDQDLAGLLTGI